MQKIKEIESERLDRPKLRKEIDTLLYEYLCRDGIYTDAEFLDRILLLLPDEKEATDKIKKIFEEIEKFRWQGHKATTSSDPPKGYLIPDNKLQILKDEVYKGGSWSAPQRK